MTKRVYTPDEQKRACIILAVLCYIQRLNAMPETEYWDTYHAWTEHRWDDPAWSEGFSHRIRGVTGPAFQSACQKIAVLAFCPGGVRVFGTWFIAKRQPDWCAWHIWTALGQQAWEILREPYEQAEAAKSEPPTKVKKQRVSKKKKEVAHG